MIHKLGIPYMGSKRKLAKSLIDFMLKENPNAKYFYDLFGGGGAISFEALQRDQITQVIYNELNTGIVELLRDIKDNGITDKYYQWIDRDTFNKYKQSDCWFGGLCKAIWSFGNNQKGYLFGKHREEDKRLLHKIVVNKCKDSLDIINNKYGININDNDSFDGETINERRLRITRNFKKVQYSKQYQLEQLEQLEQLQQLQQLERLQQLEQLQQLKITNISYNKVEIKTPINETIVYLDPPYEHTAKYQKSICYKQLYNYIDVMTKRGVTIYMSGYESKLKEVLSLNHRSILSHTTNKKVIEKLFKN